MPAKPAAVVFTDAAGKLSGEVVDIVTALEKFRRITHGMDMPPIGAIHACVISGRGIERRAKIPPAAELPPTNTKPRKG